MPAMLPAGSRNLVATDKSGQATTVERSTGRQRCRTDARQDRRRRSGSSGVVEPIEEQPGPEGKGPGVQDLEILDRRHRPVEVQLLRHGRVGPGRGHVILRPLEGQRRATVVVSAITGAAGIAQGVPGVATASGLSTTLLGIGHRASSA
jgi:hypothetical protein